MKVMEKVLSVDTLKANWEEVVNRASDAAKACGRNEDDYTVIPVSKTHPLEMVTNAQDAGMVLFGESYAQELKEKHESFDKLGRTQPTWHFIGHLQTNKVKYIAPFVDIIHSVDSVKLASEINKQAAKSNRTIDIMLQINTSGEDSKSGCEPEFIVDLAKEVMKLDNINVIGLMTIGTFSDNETIIRKEFTMLRALKTQVNTALEIDLKHLSMGMTHDFEIAIEEGATMVRVGTAVFGNRYYAQ